MALDHCPSHHFPQQTRAHHDHHPPNRPLNPLPPPCSTSAITTQPITSPICLAYEREQSAAAKDAIAQILTNSKMSATGHRPICRDTGVVNVFPKVGMDVRWEGFSGSLDDAINEGAPRLQPQTTRCIAKRGGRPQFERKTPKTIHTSSHLHGNRTSNTVEALLQPKGAALKTREQDGHAQPW